VAAAKVARAAARRALKSKKGVRLAQISKFAHALRWEYCYERLKLAQLLGQLGVFLTRGAFLKPGKLSGRKGVWRVWPACGAPEVGRKQSVPGR
jgi:hypothetical protein